MLKKTKLKSIFIIIIIIGIIIALSILLIPVTERFELRTLDLRLQFFAKKQEHDPQIVQVLLDDYSTFIASENPQLGLGRIPWPRKTWGEVLEFLNRAQPKAVVFDINYLGPEGFTTENEESDAYFTNAVKKSKAKVFFAVLFTDSIKSLEENVKDLEFEVNNRLSRIPKSMMELLNMKKIPVIDRLSKDSLLKKNITYTVYTPIMSGLLKTAYGLGAINLKTDIDGVNRYHMPLYSYNGNYYPSLSVAVAYSLLPKDKNEIELLPDKMIFGGREIYLDEEGKNFTTWYGNPKTYYVFHVIDLILGEKALKAGKKPEINPSIFKDKIIIIGQTASGSDIHHTPTSNLFVGSEIVATNIDNFLNQKKFIQKLNPNLGILLTILFCLILWGAVSKSKSIYGTVLLSLLIIGMYVLLSIYALLQFNLWLDLVGPVMLLVATFVVAYIARYVLTHRQLETAIEEATKDGLTKLYNHRFFQEKIHKDLANASRKDDRVSLCLIDIDFFKKFNDTYGHRAGDAVLIQVAQTLKENVRKSDLVARYGGEEMCVLLDKSEELDAMSVAQKLVDAVANKTFFVNDGKQEAKVTISVGVATYPTHAKNVPDLIEFADKALYRAKEGGRNQVGALYDSIDIEELPGGEKQIKEVEISKAKLIKAIDDFINLSKDQQYNYESYFFQLLKEKEVFSETFLDELQAKEGN